MRAQRTVRAGPGGLALREEVNVDDVFITNGFADWRLDLPPRWMEIVNKIIHKLRVRGVVLTPPLRTGDMTSVEQRIDMFHLLSQVLVYGVPGDVVELGCNEGKSAVLFQKIVDHFDPSRSLHLYDSFEGLPDLAAEDGDTPFRAGELKAGTERVVANFTSNGLGLPFIHKGWFQDTLPTQLPDQIAFAHLDGDLYDSILVSLSQVYPRLSKGAVVLIDDYVDPATFDGPTEGCPGVRRACDEFMADKPEKVSLLYGGYSIPGGFGSHGYFRKG